MTIGPVLATGTVSRSFGQGYVLFEIDGTQPEEGFGQSVAGLGDVDGDRVPDFAVGATTTLIALAISAPGTVRVYSGATGLQLLAVSGPGGQFGWSLAGTGDVNGDLVPDFIVGEPVDSYGGEAIVFSGADGAALLTLEAPPAPVPNPVNYFGLSVAGPGDVNGDGVPDLLIGAPLAAPGGVYFVGQAIAFSGTNGAILWTFNGSYEGERFGWSVAGAGDLDGDGKADLLVGEAPYFFTGAVGVVRAFSGGNGAPLLFILGTSGNDQFGASVGGVGDVTGDGIADFVVGATFADPGGIENAGSATLVSGSTGAPLASSGGSGAHDHFGCSVAGIGDVSGDGTPDYLVGAPYADPTGIADAGRASLLSGAGGAPLLAFEGAAPGEWLGLSVSGVGDLDDDGVPEMLIGAPQPLPALGGSLPPGQAKVLSAVGIPTGSSTFGMGCPGAGSIVPTITTFGGAPSTSAGNPRFALYLSKALGSTTAILLLGLSPLTPPLSLDPLGSPGCSLLVFPDFTFPLATSGSGAGAGKAVVPLPVPPDASLSGAELFFQWYVSDPGPGLLPGVTTQGLHLVLL
jgi:hypothetical protein